MNSYSKKKGWTHPTRTHFISIAAATSIPIFAICVFSWISLEGLGHEITSLARVYGQFLFKEQITRSLVTMARCIETPQGEEGHPAEQPKPATIQEQILQGTFCTERGEFLLVVERKGGTIIYPTDIRKGRLAFLENAARKNDLLRMIQAAQPERPVQGYFCEDNNNGTSGFSGLWYISAVQTGKDFLLVALISEKDIQVAGDTLKAAQQELLRRKGQRFIFVVLPVGLASSLLIGYLFSSIKNR